MPANEYAFVTRWRVHSSCQEISDILSDAPDLVRWWPSVYLDVRERQPGDANSIGKVVELYTKGWLPYTLRWQFCVTENRQPHGFSLEATGDFVGRGDWTFQQDGEWVDVIYHWRVRADKPILRYLSFIMKPIFAANHHWAMRKGEESLKLELQRRRVAPQAQSKIPDPPGPTFKFLLR